MNKEMLLMVIKRHIRDRIEELRTPLTEIIGDELEELLKWIKGLE